MHQYSLRFPQVIPAIIHPSETYDFMLNPYVNKSGLWPDAPFMALYIIVYVVISCLGNAKKTSSPECSHQPDLLYLDLSVMGSQGHQSWHTFCSDCLWIHWKKLELVYALSLVIHSAAVHFLKNVLLDQVYIQVSTFRLPKVFQSLI